MSSFKETPSLTEMSAASEATDTFRRKLVSNRQYLWPRRYVLALMLFLLLLIRTWRNVNVMFTLAHAVILEEGAHEIYPSIGNWTFKELDNFNTATLVTELFLQIPGALLIFTFSSHRFILASIVATSILQMMTPAALNHHSASLLVVLLSQGIIEAPIRVAIIAIWRDWAPPLERTKLIVFSVFGLLLGAAAASFYPYLFHYITTSESYYFSGISGLILALFWYNITSDTPQNDPLISEQELCYLECNIPSDVQQKIKLKDVPWKSIMTSKQIPILCIIFFKMGCSIQAIMTCGPFFGIHLLLTSDPLYLFIPFLSVFIIIIPCSAIIADCLIRRFSDKTLLIRKSFLCGGFTLQCLFLFGTFSSSEFTKAMFYMISYLCFAASIPGFITLVMDLSLRYVAIIAGFVYTFYILGYIFIQYFIENTINLLDLHSISWLFLFDGAITITAAVVFAIWGEVEEQLWSLTSPTNLHRNGYKSYPKPDDQDEMTLMPENV